MKRYIAMFFTVCLLIPAMTWAEPVVPEGSATEPPPEEVAATADTKEGVKAEPAPKEAAPVEEPKPTGEVTPEDIKKVVDDMSLLIQYAKEGKWSLFIGILLTLLVFLLDKMLNIRERVGKKALPWVAVALGMVAAIGVSLASGLDWTTALIQGFTTGTAAIGFWELVLKHFLKPKADPEVVT